MYVPRVCPPGVVMVMSRCQNNSSYFPFSQTDNGSNANLELQQKIMLSVMDKR